MRLLQVIISVDPRGGGPIESVLSSALVWARHGHVCEILSLDPPEAPWLATTPLVTHAIGPGGRGHAIARRLLPWLRYGYTARLKRWLESHAGRYDAVIVNGLWNYTSLGSWRALRAAATPYFVYPHGMLDPWFNRHYRVKFFFKNLFWRLFEHRVLRDAAGTFFTCEQERLLANESFRPYRAAEHVISFGTGDIGGDAAAQEASFRAALPTLGQRRFVLFLSRIHEKKGIDLLIAAFARHAAAHPDLDLVIAGPDSDGLQRRLVALARELGIATRLHWPGMLSGDAKWGAYRAAEFFALPSHQENFGIVVAEALALGVPVLITDKVNIWREIEESGAGMICEDDTAGVTAGLGRMLSLDHAARATLRENARRCFVERYDMERNAMSTLALMTYLAKTPDARPRGEAAPPPGNAAPPPAAAAAGS